MNRVFKIHALKNPNVDADFEAYSVPFKGRGMIGAHMMGIKEFDYPERIFFLADFLSIPHYDYITIDLTFPVMSKRMLEVLTRTNKPKYTSIPVTMIDDRYLNDPFDKNGSPKFDVPSNDDYFAIHITEYADVFSYEKSVFKPDMVFPEDVGEIEKLVLRNSANGFPAFFKIKESRPLFFINEETKNILERKKIVGCSFEEVEVEKG